MKSLNLAGVILLAFATAAAAQGPLSEPGPHQAGTARVTIEPASGAAFTALLFYPAIEPGELAPVDLSGAPYPAISFGHGFLQAPWRYEGTLAHLATWGFVVIATESQQGFSTNHAQFALDLRACLTWLEDEHARPGALLFNAVDVMAFGLCGHSMGGGASVLAAADDPRVRAIATLAAAETTPSAAAAAARLTIPSSYLSGSQDSITPVGAHGRPMYDATTAPRQLPLILGGSHCGFQDVPYPLFCDSGSMPRAEQLALTRRLLTEFFLLHLAGEQRLWPPVWGPDALTDARIDLDIDPRTLLAAPAAAAGRAGEAIEVELKLSNLPPASTSLELFAEQTDWPVSFTPQQTPPLAPGAEALVSMRVQIPAGAAGSGEREILVSARRTDDDATRAYTTILIDAGCYADCDSSGALDFFDFLCFQEAFAAGAPSADCDGSGELDFFDFLCFQSAFAAGCL